MPNPEHLGGSPWIGEEPLMNETAEMVRDQGTFAAARHYLENLNFVPKFTKSEEMEFASSREKLVSKPGLVIANHPSALDTPLILSQINRRDLKIIAHRKRINQLAILDPDLFLPAAKSPGQLRQVLSAVHEHIESGGLTLIYPTAGQGVNRKGIDRSNRGFQSGFRAIVQRLKPDDMVYSFYINLDDVSAIKAQMPKGTLQRLNQPQEIRIEEAYSEAAEWQAIINSSGRDDVNEQLTKHFLDKFHRERFD